MAITGKTSSTATIYYGPSTTTYVAQTTLSANVSLTLLWKEGQFYYVECSSPARRGYISVSLVTNISGGTPSTYIATYLTRYVYGEGSAMCGPGTSYPTAGSLEYRQSVKYLSGKSSGSYYFIEFTETGATRKKRGWFLQTKLTTTLPTPQIYTDGHVFNGDGEKWKITTAWNEASQGDSYKGHLGIDIIRQNSSGSQLFGKAVYAIAAGTVALKGTSNANGNYVIIQHTISGCTYFSTYFHLDSYYNLTSVSAGDAIGVMGDTGTSSAGEHLHLAITKTNRGGDNYGYYRDSNGNKATFTETGSGYLDWNSTRYYNPTRYFTDGASFISNNYS